VNISADAQRGSDGDDRLFDTSNVIRWQIINRDNVVAFEDRHGRSASFLSGRHPQGAAVQAGEVPRHAALAGGAPQVPTRPWPAPRWTRLNCCRSRQGGGGRNLFGPQRNMIAVLEEVFEDATNIDIGHPVTLPGGRHHLQRMGPDLKILIQF
jgi:hypothetical protein